MSAVRIAVRTRPAEGVVVFLLAKMETLEGADELARVSLGALRVDPSKDELFNDLVAAFTAWLVRVGQTSSGGAVEVGVWPASENATNDGRKPS